MTAKTGLDRLWALYTDMVRIRLVEEKIAQLYPQQKMRCPVHLCIGQEAAAVGVCANLRKQDIVLSNHRAHGHYLAKGGDLTAMLAELHGKQGGCARGRGGSMHLIDLRVNFLGSTPIVGGTIPVATGVAFAEKQKRRDTVTACFFGEAAVEEGVFHESLNFAVLHRLPIVYICENNLYSVYTPLAQRQPPRSIHRLAQAHGAYALEGDGNDVITVNGLMRQALEIIAAGKGPVFMELATYRWREHCGPNYDNDLGYRSRQEFEEWRMRCPLKRLEQTLTRKGLDQKKFKDAAAVIESEFDAAMAAVEAMSDDRQELTPGDVYAE